MIEALYKKIIIFFMVISSCLFASSEIIQNQIKVTYTQSTQPNLSMEDLGNFHKKYDIFLLSNLYFFLVLDILNLFFLKQFSLQ